MGDPYNSGHHQGYVHATVDESLSNMIDSNCYSPFPQQALINQNAHSSTTRSRHDSVDSQLSPQVPQYPVGQHQAETQPRAAQLTPHTGNTYPYQPEAMSRVASHASHRPSTSSTQQYGGPHFVQRNSVPSIWSSNGLDMQRSRSMYSNASTLHSQHVSPQLGASQAYQLCTDSYPPEPMDILATNFPIATQHHSLNAHLNESLIDCFSNNAMDMNLLDFGIGDIGHNAGQPSYLTTLTPQFRPRAKSDGHPTQRPLSCTLLSAPDVKTTVDPTVSSDSATSQSPLPTRQPRHRHRARTPPSDSESEVITGHVLASGRFKCSEPKCDDLRFGRQADFRRHYINVHALKKKEYFCTIEGCDRSRRPLKKNKGRSFGARKDKMKEHVQTVHFKESKKRKRSPQTEADNQDKQDRDSEPESKTSL